MSQVLVTGATGFLGAYLCHDLIRDGYEVTIYRRQSSNLSLLEGLDLRYQIGDITDREALENAIKGHDVVVHAAAIGGNYGASALTDINVNATRDIVEVCEKYNIKRLLYISSVAAIGIPSDPNEPADETFQYNLENSNLSYNHSRRQAEAEILCGFARGMDVVIVNPGSILGPFGNSFRDGGIIRKIQQRAIVPYFYGGLSCVHVSDVATGVLQALKHGRNGERYILSGENVLFREIAESAAECMSLKRVFVPVPYFTTWLAATIFEILAKGTGGRPRLSYVEHQYVNRFHFYNSNKAKQELDYSPRPFKEILKNFIFWLEETKSI